LLNVFVDVSKLLWYIVIIIFRGIILMNSENIFSIRLREEMSIKGVRQVDLCQKTGISKSAISQYLTANFVPKSDRIYLLADALDVSPQWLLGYDVNKNSEETVESKLPAEDEFPDDIRIIARGMTKLSPEMRKVLLKVVKSMSEEADKELKK
jgi:transcriptional regulator with XRE-family HTH domain